MVRNRGFPFKEKGENETCPLAKGELRSLFSYVGRSTLSPTPYPLTAGSLWEGVSTLSTCSRRYFAEK